MSSVDPPGWSDSTPHDLPGSYRARHGPAAPEAYEGARSSDAGEEPGRYGYVYGDGLSAYPLYDGDNPAPWSPRPLSLTPEQPAAEAAPETALQPALDRGAEPQPQPDLESARAAAKRRAGRNLPAAIAVGLSLGALVLVSLLLWRPGFLLLETAAAGIGTWEMTGALAGGPQRPEAPSRPPLLPLLAGCVVMTTLAWFAGVEALVLGLALTVLAALVWRLADGPAGYQRDMVGATLVAVYVPFLAGFAVLLARPSDGAGRVIVTLAAVVLSDTGGYVAGVLFGKRQLAPSVSPSKSWEGLGGSLVATGVGGALLMYFVFHHTWWYGAIFGLAVSAVSVLGDLAESMVKRDLGIKDMSSLLPGHGGLMDRLDSVLFAAPTAFVLLSLLAPPPH